MALLHHWPNFIFPEGVVIPPGFRLLRWKRDLGPHWKHKDHNIHLFIYQPGDLGWNKTVVFDVCSEVDARDPDVGGSTAHEKWEDALKELRELVDYYEDGLCIPYHERVVEPKNWETY